MPAAMITAEMGDEPRGEQQLLGEERHLLQARPQEREHNSSLRSGKSRGRRDPQRPGLGLRHQGALSSPYSFSQLKGGSQEARESESLFRLEASRLFPA